MVTLDDIARATGLSKATVSRALSGHPRVAQATRARVAGVAKELGYRPDAALSALARRRWPTGRKPDSAEIVYLHNLDKNVPERIERYREAAADEFGYELSIERLDAISDLHAYADTLEQRGIRGIILHAADDLADETETFDRCARVVIGYGF
ncbi:MAG: LacI family DNA-binding transcriptional regulator, partial [Planctomycetota bacterium]|nr:LacI family DNA-binding transcriptional regulator [Planctomycetota bacterium]